MDKLRVLEAISGSEVDGKPGVFKICVIKAGFGSSGFYPAEVLKRDGATAFPADTQVYLDHETESERWDRPERTVRDLIGYLSTDAEWQEDGLYAEMTIFPSMAPSITEKMAHVGMSIRAYAEAEYDEIEGQFVSIVTRLLEGVSVDVVTKAGAGGAILQAVESAVKDPTDGDTQVLKHLKENTLWRKASEAKPTPNSGTPNDRPVVESRKDSVMAELSDETAKTLADTLSAHTETMEKVLAAQEASNKRAEESAAAAAKEGEVSPLDVAAALVESELPKAAHARVLESVKGGVALEEAIKSEKEYIDSFAVTQESTADQLFGGRRMSESGSAGTDLIKEATEFAASWGKGR